MGMLAILLDYDMVTGLAEACRNHLCNVAVIFYYQYGFHSLFYGFNSAWTPSTIYSIDSHALVMWSPSLSR